jgi:hypothetical protein
MAVFMMSRGPFGPLVDAEAGGIVNAHTGGGALSSFLLPSTVIVFVYTWTTLFPEFLWHRGSAQRIARGAALGVLTIGVLATAITISLRYQRKFDYRLVTPRGTWLVPPDEGIPFARALQLISSGTTANDPIAVMPERTSLHFFADRPNPLHDEIVTPGFLDAAGECKAITALGASRTKLVLIASRPTPEFFQQSFGIDYDTKLMNWIDNNYDKCGSFSVNPRFRIVAYCLPQP